MSLARRTLSNEESQGACSSGACKLRDHYRQVMAKPKGRRVKPRLDQRRREWEAHRHARRRRGGGRKSERNFFFTTTTYQQQQLLFQ